MSSAVVAAPDWAHNGKIVEVALDDLHRRDVVTAVPANAEDVNIPDPLGRAFGAKPASHSMIEEDRILR